MFGLWPVVSLFTPYFFCFFFGSIKQIKQTCFVFFLSLSYWSDHHTGWCYSYFNMWAAWTGPVTSGELVLSLRPQCRCGKNESNPAKCFQVLKTFGFQVIFPASTLGSQNSTVRCHGLWPIMNCDLLLVDSVMITDMNYCVHIQIWGWQMTWKHLVGFD